MLAVVTMRMRAVLAGLRSSACAHQASAMQGQAALRFARGHVARTGGRPTSPQVQEVHDALCGSRPKVGVGPHKTRRTRTCDGQERVMGGACRGPRGTYCVGGRHGEPNQMSDGLLCWHTASREAAVSAASSLAATAASRSCSQRSEQALQRLHTRRLCSGRMHSAMQP